MTALASNQYIDTTGHVCNRRSDTLEVEYSSDRLNRREYQVHWIRLNILIRSMNLHHLRRRTCMFSSRDTIRTFVSTYLFTK